MIFVCDSSNAAAFSLFAALAPDALPVGTAVAAFVVLSALAFRAFLPELLSAVVALTAPRFLLFCKDADVFMVCAVLLLAGVFHGH